MTADLAILILACAAWLNRAQDRRLRFLVVQNRVLRETRADVRRMTTAHRRALGEAAHGLDHEDLAACEPIVTVDTLRRYYRELVIAKWSHPSVGAAGRPPLSAETVAAVLRLARENPRVGAPGIVRRLAAIGIAVWRAACGTSSAPMTSARHPSAVTRAIGVRSWRLMPSRSQPSMPPRLRSCRVIGWSPSGA